MKDLKKKYLKQTTDTHYIEQTRTVPTIAKEEPVPKEDIIHQ